jgi:hypothetical protein
LLVRRAAVAASAPFWDQKRWNSNANLGTTSNDIPQLNGAAEIPKFHPNPEPGDRAREGAETDELRTLFGYPEDLFNRRNPFQHLADAVVVKRGHAALYRGLADVLGRCALEGELADL